MAFTFNRSLTGYFEWKLMELLYRYSENQHVLRGIHYLDLTLVDPENSVVIYKQLKDIQFVTLLQQNMLQRLMIRVDNVRIILNSQDGGVVCWVETYSETGPKLFYPTVITLFN